MFWSLIKKTNAYFTEYRHWLIEGHFLRWYGALANIVRSQRYYIYFYLHIILFYIFCIYFIIVLFFSIFVSAIKWQSIFNLVYFSNWALNEMNMQIRVPLGSSQFELFSYFFLEKQRKQNPLPPPQQKPIKMPIPGRTTNLSQKKQHKHENSVSFHYSTHIKKWHKHGKLLLEPVEKK